MPPPWKKPGFAKPFRRRHGRLRCLEAQAAMRQNLGELERWKEERAPSRVRVFLRRLGVTLRYLWRRLQSS